VDKYNSLHHISCLCFNLGDLDSVFFVLFWVNDCKVKILAEASWVDGMDYSILLIISFLLL
jgi:hypothetical protein